MKKSDIKSSLPDNSPPEPTKGAPKLEVPQLSDGDLGKIQEILMGKQLLATSAQIESLQTYFLQKLALLSEDHNRQISGLHRKLDEAEADFAYQLKQQKNAHQLKLENVTNNLSNSLGTAESSLSDRLTNVTDSLKSTRKDLISQMEKTTQDLQSTKIDRDSMSIMFGKLAGELSANADHVESKESHAPTRK